MALGQVRIHHIIVHVSGLGWSKECTHGRGKIYIVLSKIIDFSLAPKAQSRSSPLNLHFWFIRSDDPTSFKSLCVKHGLEETAFLMEIIASKLIHSCVLCMWHMTHLFIQYSRWWCNSQLEHIYPHSTAWTYMIMTYMKSWHSSIAATYYS